MNDEDSGPIGRVRRDVAQLRSEHEKLRADHDEDHKALRMLQQTDAGQVEILKRIEAKVDTLLAIETRVRDLERASAERRGRWWAVAGIAGVLVAVFTATTIALVTDWIKPRPTVAPLDNLHRAPDGDPLPPWRR